MHFRIVRFASDCLPFVAVEVSGIHAGSTVNANRNAKFHPVGSTSCLEIGDSASTAGGGGAAFFQNYPKPYCQNRERALCEVPNVNGEAALQKADEFTMPVVTAGTFQEALR